MLPKGGSWGFFGWNSVIDRYGTSISNPSSHSTSSSNSSSSSANSSSSKPAVIITEGEYDAMAVAQALADFHTAIVDKQQHQISTTTATSNITSTASNTVSTSHSNTNKTQPPLDSKLAETFQCQQFDKIPVISLPNGCSSLPPELLPLLEKYVLLPLL